MGKKCNLKKIYTHFYSEYPTTKIYSNNNCYLFQGKVRFDSLILKYIEKKNFKYFKLILSSSI